MTRAVPAEDIERIVGATRHPYKHLGRAVSAEQTVYILHSWGCFEAQSDLRRCRYSLALDRGIDADTWAGHEDRPVVLFVIMGRLVPVDYPRRDR